MPRKNVSTLYNAEPAQAADIDRIVRVLQKILAELKKFSGLINKPKSGERSQAMSEPATMKATHTAGPWTVNIREQKSPCCGSVQSSIGYIKADIDHIEVAVKATHTAGPRLFNPELMAPGAVRELVIDLAKEVAALAAARLAATRDAASWLVMCPDCDHGIRGGAPCGTCEGHGTVSVVLASEYAAARLALQQEWPRPTISAPPSPDKALD